MLLFSFRRSLLVLLERSLRRGARFLAPPREASDSDDADGSPEAASGDEGPPAHWLEDVQRGPPLHWLQAVREAPLFAREHGEAQLPEALSSHTPPHSGTFLTPPEDQEVSAEPSPAVSRDRPRMRVHRPPDSPTDHSAGASGERPPAETVDGEPDDAGERARRPHAESDPSVEDRNTSGGERRRSPEEGRAREGSVSPPSLSDSRAPTFRPPEDEPLSRDTPSREASDEEPLPERLAERKDDRHPPARVKRAQPLRAYIRAEPVRDEPRRPSREPVEVFRPAPDPHRENAPPAAPSPEGARLDVARPPVVWQSDSPTPKAPEAAPRWPTLMSAPAEEKAADERKTALNVSLRARERRRRLDNEQEGGLWNT